MLADSRGLLDAVPGHPLLSAARSNSASLDEGRSSTGGQPEEAVAADRPDDGAATLLIAWWSGFDVVLLIRRWHMMRGVPPGCRR